MESLWQDTAAAKLKGDLLDLRVYTSQLLGQDPSLVLHGGGNTSVKIKVTNPFGEEEDILYVKGSGWDLATIQRPGFAPVKLDTLLKMAELDTLSDPDMVRYQRMAMIDPAAPNPSVEAILHAIIPYTFVDHTHADAVVTISNTPDGATRIEALYGVNYLIIPYVMPGFILAKTIYEQTKHLDWSTIEGIILMNHGVFTFANTAKESYDKMIGTVTMAEDYLDKADLLSLEGAEEGLSNTLELAALRKKVATVLGKPLLARHHRAAIYRAFSDLDQVDQLINKGPLTPDHIIRTKQKPLLLNQSIEAAVEQFVANYQAYFARHQQADLQCLDQAPRWAVWPNHGTVSFGTTPKQLKIIQDISTHTMQAIHKANQLNAWQALPEADLFEMEYWVLEQMKLKRKGVSKPMEGKVALVTGAASGIGKATVEALLEAGAVVAALDLNPEVTKLFPADRVLGIPVDVTHLDEVENAIVQVVEHFGGLDLLVANAGIFPQSAAIAEMDAATWDKSLAVNVSSQQRLLQACYPYLALGIDPAVVLVASKNVPAPGPGAAAYSVAKAGLTQLGRIAAMEWGKAGIRVNMVHPNAVYDTAIWTEEVLANRAAHYGLTVDAYKTNNILGIEVASQDVADLIVLLLGPAFAKVTGIQLPIDGGNNRVI